MSIKDALKYAVELSEPNINEIGGQSYSDKPLYRIKHNPKASEIVMHTLSGLVDYITSGVDTFKEKMIVHIISPTEVRLFSALDDERVRENIVIVRAQVPSFELDKFMEHERFVIGVQSKFVDDAETDKAVLLKFAGTVEAGTVAEYGDDGISQKATIKTGLASKGEALVPSPVVLRPFRTFVEVKQPLSSFVFRMKEDKYSGVNCALFEADGGAWKLEAIGAISDFLTEALADYPQFIIIS